MRGGANAYDLPAVDGISRGMADVVAGDVLTREGDAQFVSPAGLGARQSNAGTHRSLARVPVPDGSILVILVSFDRLVVMGARFGRQLE